MKSVGLFLLYGLLSGTVAIPDWIYFGRGLNTREINRFHQRCDSCSSEESDKPNPNGGVIKVDAKTTKNLVETHPTTPTSQSTTLEVLGTEKQTELPIQRRISEQLTTSSQIISQSTLLGESSRLPLISSTSTAKSLIRAKPDTLAPIPEAKTIVTTEILESTVNVLNTTLSTEPTAPLYLKPDLAMILKKLFKGTKDF